MERIQLMEFFNKQPRIGTLSTADTQGNVNVAVFGSPRMTDENTVIMGAGDNRSLSYLKQNPKAVFIFMEPGLTPFEWKGARVYLRVAAIEESGPFFENMVEGIRKAVGDQAAGMIKAAVRFEITAIRDLVDMGK